MGQKTHPIGFRIGVPSKTNSIGYSQIDIHGLTSRWAISNSGNVNNYSDLSQRDRIIKTIIEQFMEEDGYMTNKCIITRTSSYIGIYVDGIELEEPNVYYQGESNSTEEKQTSINNNVNSINTKNIENYISKYVENNTPVHIQFVLLENKTKDFSEVNRSEIDLHKTISLLVKDNIPCCSVLAKIISINRSQGGRRERETLRLVMKLMNSYYSKEEIGVFKGYLIMFKGRIGGSERSRIIRYRSGPMPRHTVSAGIDQGYSEVNTVSGKVSVTVMAYFK